MIFPELPQKGEKVGLVCPSSPVPPARAAACAAWVESRGYQVVKGKSLNASLHGYSAGSPKLRAADLNDMFADPAVKAILCLRGGDSGNQVLEFLDYEVIRSNPKVFMGYSDITNFHVVLNQRCNLITFHGPMVSSNLLEDFDPFTEKVLRNALMLGRTNSMLLENPPGEEFQRVQAGFAAGRLCGGNLSLVCSLLGTPYELDTRDKIFFLEDVNESTAHVDRYFHQLRQAGKFDAAAGVLIGDFAGQSNPLDPAYLVDELVEEFFAGGEKPVLANVKSGHCKPMSTLPLGAVCELDAGAKEVYFHL